MKEFSYCYRCKLENQAGFNQCAQCGGRVVSSKRARVLGVMLIVIGLFLALTMGGLTVFFASLMVHSGSPGSTGSFTGTPEQATAIFGLFGVIFAIGLTSLVGGIYQIKYGRRSLLIQIFTFVLVGLVVLAYWMLKAFFPEMQK